MRHPHFSREEIVDFQNKRLRCLINHADENVPYYHRLFDQKCIKSKDIQSFAIPYIRYRLDDIVKNGFETGRCGQPFSTIRSIQRHMPDNFPLPRGRAIHHYEMTPFIVRNTAPWIRQFQLTQERVDYIIMRVVASSNATPQELAGLVECVKNLLGQGVEFRVLFVPEIQLEPSSKFRVSRSLVNSAYDGIGSDNLQTLRAPYTSRHEDQPS